MIWQETPQESSELLASRLKEKNLLQPGTFITYYRNRHAEFLPFFYTRKRYSILQ